MKFIKQNYLLILISALSFFIRLISLNQSYWLDEATTAQVCKNFSLIEIITKFSPGDFHPPLYYLIAKIWSNLFGVGEIQLRMLSVLFGVFSVIVIYKVAEKISGKAFALTTSVLLATSPLHIYYSQEARMYILETFFVLLSVFFYQKILEKESLMNWIVFSFSIILIGFTDYLPLLIVPTFLIHSIFVKKDFKLFRNLLVSLLPFSILFSYWFPVFKNQFLGGISVVSNSPGWWKVLGRFSVKEVLLIPIKFVTGRISISNKFYYFPIFTPYILLSLLFCFKKRKNSNIYYPLLWFFVPLLLIILLSLKISVLSYFRLLFILPAFYLILSYALDQQNKKVKNVFLYTFIVLNLIFSFIYLLNPKFHRENWRDAVAFIEATSPGDQAETLFVTNSQMEAYNYYSSGSIKTVAPGHFEAKSKTIWLMRYVQDIFDPEDSVRIDLEKAGYQKTEEHDFNGVVVFRYDK